MKKKKLKFARARSRIGAYNNDNSGERLNCVTLINTATASTTKRAYILGVCAYVMCIYVY